MSGAAAAVEEQVEGEPKKKGPLIKIIIMVVAVLVLIGGSVGGTLFATGFFSKKEKAGPNTVCTTACGSASSTCSVWPGCSAA